MRLRLATRGSPQARRRPRRSPTPCVAAAGADVELVFVETTGDRQRDVPLHVIGGQGVFVKEVQHAVLDGRADAAVHSAKDLPSIAHPALTIGAFTRRRDPADALIGRSLAELADGATVATGSVRRRAQLAEARPDLQFVELRGNIATRLERIPDGGAIVMAVAALEVLGLTDRIAERLDVERLRAGRRAGLRRRRGPARRPDHVGRRSRPSTTPRPATPSRSSGRSSSSSAPGARFPSAPTSRAARCTRSSPVTSVSIVGCTTCGSTAATSMSPARRRRHAYRLDPPRTGPARRADSSSLGATVVHVPLIEITDAPDARRAALAAARRRSTGSSSRR